MKVKFIQSIAGKGFSYGKGAVADLPTIEAKSYIKAGVAVAIKKPKSK
jgi:hypothetical protein